MLRKGSRLSLRLPAKGGLRAEADRWRGAADVSVLLTLVWAALLDGSGYRPTAAEFFGVLASSTVMTYAWARVLGW